MLKPNYKKSTLNLIASISSAFGYKTSHPPLKNLNPQDLKNAQNVVFLLIDGLGYDFLKKYGQGTEFEKNIKDILTTTFPSSTSAATTSILTGKAPREHGMTGWNMFMKELGDMIIPLPYVKRDKRGKIENPKVSELFNITPYTSKIKVPFYMIQPKEIINSDFTNAITSKKATKYGYVDTKDYFSKIKKAIKSKKKEKYIYAYYNKHDSLCHKHGITSKKVQTHFKKLCKEFEKFLKSINDTNTLLIITSDHGQIDIPKNRRIDLSNYPKINECLSMPMCGEARFGYCYVKPSKEKQFVKEVKKHLNNYCHVYKSETLLKKGYFGKYLKKEHPNFKHRIGDYILITKENYGLYHFPAYTKKKRHNLADHGGLSHQELLVPLILIKK